MGCTRASGRWGDDTHRIHLLDLRRVELCGADRAPREEVAEREVAVWRLCEATKIVIRGAVGALQCARAEEGWMKAFDRSMGIAYREARKRVRTRNGAQEEHNRQMMEEEAMGEVGAEHRAPPPIVPNPKIVGIERRGIGW